MSDEGQKAVEAAGKAIYELNRYSGEGRWADITDPLVKEGRCDDAKAAIRAWLAALSASWVAPRPPGMNDEAWEVLKKLSPPPGLED